MISSHKLQFLHENELVCGNCTALTFTHTHTYTDTQEGKWQMNHGYGYIMMGNLKL